MSKSPGGVVGYTSLPAEAVELMNKIKVHEERIMRAIDELCSDPDIDQRWLAIARTELQKSYMCLNRAVARPGRVALEALPENFIEI